MIILSPSPSLYHRATRQTPNARVRKKVPLDPFEKDASRELDTFKERLGAWRVKKPWEMGCFNEGKWRLITIKW